MERVIIFIVGWLLSGFVIATTLPPAVETWLVSYTDNNELAENIVFLLQEAKKYDIIFC